MAFNRPLSAAACPPTPCGTFKSTERITYRRIQVNINEQEQWNRHVRGERGGLADTLCDVGTCDNRRGQGKAKPQGKDNLGLTIHSTPDHDLQLEITFSDTGLVAS